MGSLFAKKPIESARVEGSQDRLHRVLGPWALTALGIGAVIGAGIFVATGKAANETAGPALMVSYVLAGFTCLLAALCYAEFAAMTPVAGSAYTYAYTTLGELFAWIIGWDLILEYAVGASTVANGWSSYFSNGCPSEVRPRATRIPRLGPARVRRRRVQADRGSFINLPAVLIVALLTIILVKGIKESAALNAIMVAIKVGAVLFVILVGAYFINPDQLGRRSPRTGGPGSTSSATRWPVSTQGSSRSG